MKEITKLALVNIIFTCIETLIVFFSITCISSGIKDYCTFDNTWLGLLFIFFISQIIINLLAEIEDRVD